MSDGPKAAGVILKAADTGRILLLQRGLDPTDPAAGKWEAPGGHIENGEHPHQAAMREFAEEVGHPVPPAARLVDQWDSTNGIYRSHLMVVPSEDHIDINLPHADRYVPNPDDPDGDVVETAAWWDPKDLRSNPAVRQEMRGTRWTRIEQAEAATKAWPVATADSLHYRRAFNPVEKCPNCRYYQDSYCTILNRQVAADAVCDDWTAQAGKAWTVGARKDRGDQPRDEQGRFASDGGGGGYTGGQEGVDRAMHFVTGMNIANSEPVDRTRLGRCYELAANKVVEAKMAKLTGEPVDEPNPVVVHGSIQGFGHPAIGHAWVETPDGSKSWEPATNKWYPTPAFHAYYNSVVDRKYPADEAARQMVRTGHYGPWAGEPDRSGRDPEVGWEAVGR